MLTWAKLGLGIVKFFNWCAHQWELAKAEQRGAEKQATKAKAVQDEKVADAVAARTDDSVLAKVDETRYRD